MKRKPLWALWILVIIAPFAIFFVLNSREKPRLRDTLTRDEITFDEEARSNRAQGRPHISTLRLSPFPDDIGYLVRVSLSNSSGVSIGSITIVSGASEIAPGNDNKTFKNGDDLSLNCYGRPYCSTTVFTVKKKRSQPIRIHVDWLATDAAQHSVQSQKDFVITPQMKQ